MSHVDTEADWLLSMVRIESSLQDGDDPVGWLDVSVAGGFLTVRYEIDEPREVVERTWKLVPMESNADN